MVEHLILIYFLNSKTKFSSNTTSSLEWALKMFLGKSLNLIAA